MSNITILSLEEPVRYFTNSILQIFSKNPKFNKETFDPLIYMRLLLLEITNEKFKDPAAQLKSTELLMQFGLNEDAATELGLKVFKMTVDILSDSIPEMCFSKTSNEYMFDFVNTYDLSIMWSQSNGIEKNVFD